ncbi:unnamed protein product [Prunus brigantina]
MLRMPSSMAICTKSCTWNLFPDFANKWRIPYVGSTSPFIDLNMLPGTGSPNFLVLFNKQAFISQKSITYCLPRFEIILLLQFLFMRMRYFLQG